MQMFMKRRSTCLKFMKKSSKVMIQWLTEQVYNKIVKIQPCILLRYFFYNINNLLYTLSQALYFDGLAVTSEYVGGKSSLGSYSFLDS